MNTALTISETLAHVEFRPTESTIPPPITDVGSLLRYMTVGACLGSGAACVFEFARLAWTWKHEDGREAQDLKWLALSGLCLIVSVTAYQAVRSIT